MRTSDYIAVLYRAGLVKFGSKADMRTTDDEIIRQFLAGRAMGPIGMDEMATEQSDIERELVERETARRVCEMLEPTKPDAILTGLGGHGVAAIYDSGAPGPTSAVAICCS